MPEHIFSAKTGLSDITLEFHPEDPDYPFWCVVRRLGWIFHIVATKTARDTFKYCRHQIRADERERLDNLKYSEL